MTKQEVEADLESVYATRNRRIKSTNPMCKFADTLDFSAGEQSLCQVLPQGSNLSRTELPWVIHFIDQRIWLNEQVHAMKQKLEVVQQKFGPTLLLKLCIYG